MRGQYKWAPDSTSLIKITLGFVEDQGYSVKRLSRELHVSRNTVRKIVRSKETAFHYGP